LAHWALVGLYEDFIQRGVAYTIIDGVIDWAMKQNLFMGGKRFLSVTFNQVLKLEVVIAAAAACNYSLQHQVTCRLALQQVEARQHSEILLIAVPPTRVTELNGTPLVVRHGMLKHHLELANRWSNTAKIVLT
jgi:hypothetical protein